MRGCAGNCCRGWSGEWKNCCWTARSAPFAGRSSRKQFPVSEIAKWYLARIEALTGPVLRLNAIRTIAPDALDVARQFDDEVASGRIRGPLHGIPVVLKDNILTGDGMTAAAGAAALAGFKPRSDATLVRRLRQAGALILGKTNLTEFADYVSDVMPSGFSGAGGMVKNPHSVAAYGRGLGSSVGSAAAVAASLTPIAIGSETQNSIQTPACVSSVFGFKPSVGMVSRAGVVPLVPSQDSPGPLARSVEELALLMSSDCRRRLPRQPERSRRFGSSRWSCASGIPRAFASAYPAAASPTAPIWKVSCRRFEAALRELAKAV